MRKSGEQSGQTSVSGGGFIWGASTTKLIYKTNKQTTICWPNVCYLTNVYCIYESLLNER